MASASAILPASELQHFEQFRSTVSSSFCPMACEPPAGAGNAFRGSVVAQALHQTALTAVRSSPLDVYRRRSDIASADESAYLVKVQVSGESFISQRGREAHLRPGDFVLCLSSEPYELHFQDDYSQLVLSVPQQMLEECVRSPQRLLGLRMDSREGTNGLFSQFVTSIGARLQQFDAVVARRLEANVIDLLSTTLGCAAGGDDAFQLPASARGDYLRRIRAFVHAHLSDPRLSPGFIAQQHQISTRYLHMLFADEDESVSRYIMRLRLDACRAAFADAAWEGRPVSEIAYHFGFNDASHFSRVFKQQFGQTPAGYRRSCP